MDPPQPMDANLSATLENSPEPEGNDIRRAPAGYLVHSGRVVVRAVEVHHINIRSAGLRTPAGPRPPAGSVDGGLKSLYGQNERPPAVVTLSIGPVPVT